MIREQGAGKRGEKKERKMQESQTTSQEENADVVSEQSTESSVFEETSLVKPLLREEAKRDQFVARNSERRAKERTRKQERVVREAGSWPQQGGTTCSQQLRENYDNQGALSSSSIQSNKIVEAGSWPQQGGTTCSQQLRENYDNQGALSSSSIQSNKIVDDSPLLQQGAFLD